MRLAHAISLLPAGLAALLTLSGCYDTPRFDGDDSEPPATKPAAASPAAAPPPANRRIVFLGAATEFDANSAGRRGALMAGKTLGMLIEYQVPDMPGFERQAEMLHLFTDQHADAIVLWPEDATALTSAIDRAANSGSQVFTWMTDAPSTRRILHFAGPNDAMLGAQAVVALSDAWSGKGLMQIVAGDRGSPSTSACVSGILDELKRHSGIAQAGRPLYAGGTSAAGIASSVINKSPGLTGFVCADPVTAASIVDALAQMRATGKVDVWCVGVDDMVKAHVRSGAISGVVTPDPALLTFAIARLVNDILDGKLPKDRAEVDGIGILFVTGQTVRIPGLLVTSENALHAFER